MHSRSLWLTVWLMICLWNLNNGYINVYLPKDEVFKLFGIQNAELYYVRDGKVNQNALDFVARVQPEHNSLKYMWYSTISEVVIYDIFFSSTNEDTTTDETITGQMKKLVKPPTSSLTESGQVPQKLDFFTVNVDCTGDLDGNITFTTTLKINLSPVDDKWTKVINITRLKKCIKTYSSQKEEEEEIKQDIPKQDIIPVDDPGQSMQQSTTAFYISVSAVSSVIVLIVVGVFVWHIRVSKRHRGQGADAMHRIHTGAQNGNQFLKLDLPNNAHRPPSHSSLVQLTPLINDLGTAMSEIQGKLSDICLSRSSVTLEELLLKGTFARIYKGSLEDGTKILVKTVTDAATNEQKRLLLFESSLLRGLQHRNLLSIKHVVLDNAPEAPMVLFPYMEGGNLKHFLQSIKLNEAPGLVPGFFSNNLNKYEQVSTQDLVEMSIQIACGMTFLSKRGVVHKDLAARNCVIDHDLKIKITDYALSRDAFPGDYCCLGDYENRPVRWLGLESLIHKVYSSASDVWSFGILLWELQSLAATPYADIDDFEMGDYLSDGFRLSQPMNCPDRLYSIMAECWHYAPDQRPSFTRLFQMLTEFYAELGDYV